MFCGNDSLVGVADRGVAVVPLRCKRWSCDECMPYRLALLRHLAASGEPTTLITLTCKPSQHADEADGARALVRCWRNMVQRITREGYAKRVPFIAVFEEHKSGWPHLHILCRLPYVPQSVLSAWSRKWIGAHRVDIRRVYNRRHASRYIAKYVSKGPGRFDGTKRYWRSQDYSDESACPKPVHDANTRWWKQRDCPDYLVWNLQKCDWHHSTDEPNSIWLIPGPKALWIFPGHDPPPITGVQPWKPIAWT